jgi:DNA ligase D-like protein (predicted ligase)
MAKLDDFKDKAEKKSMPDWLNPMLATLTHDYFDDKDWIYERKWDGERALVYKKSGDVKIYSRNKKELNNTYPELEEAFEKLKQDNFIADGEICSFEGDKSSFSRLQGRMQIKNREEAKKSKIKVFFYFLDLLYLDGYEITGLALRDRKNILQDAFKFKDPLRFTPHRNEKGKKYHKEACEKGWEGIIAKDASAAYTHGRSKKWLKFKCVNQQEFVIGGYTEPEGQRKGFGALLIGYYEREKLKYAGKVGTGYNDKLLESLSDKMKKIESDENPFRDSAKDIKLKNVHWIRPELVGEVAFTEWTNDGRLRHPAFKGLRDDKKPEKVVREG